MEPQPPAPETLPSPVAPSAAPEPKPFKLHRRFDRTGRLLGDPAMERLSAARVVVFGMGGVGSYAAEGIVRSGVGQLTLVDFDTASVPNSNPHLHPTPKPVAKPNPEMI